MNLRNLWNKQNKSASHSVFLNWYIQRQYLKWRVQKMIIFMLLFSFCWDSKFIVYCIVNCIEIRFEVLELYCYCIGWNYSLVVLYCNCIAKISIAYYFIWIVLDSKSPYWSTLINRENLGVALQTSSDQILLSNNFLFIIKWCLATNVSTSKTLFPNLSCHQYN